MARSSAAAQDSAPAPAREVASAAPAGIELAGVGLLLVGLVLAGALATLAPPEAGGGIRNIAGEVGSAVAGALSRALGLGAWALPAAAIGWGILGLTGRRPRSWGMKVALLAVTAVLTAVLASLLLRRLDLPGTSRSGPGGWLGLVFSRALHGTLGKAGGLVVLFAWLVSLRLVIGLPWGAALARWLPWRRATQGTGAAIEQAPEATDDDDEEDDEDEEEEVEEEAAVAAPAVRVLSPATPRAAVAKPRPRARPARTDYSFPPVDLLERGIPHDGESVREEVEANARILQQTLASFDVEARVVSLLRGPVITFYEIETASGVRLSRVTALADDLAIALKAPSVRIVAPIPGKNTVGVEVPNLARDPVVLRDLLECSREHSERKEIPIFLAKDTAGRPIVEDLASMPHLLVAGATGSGKSVCINSILLSILYSRTPEEVRLILVDPKQVELSFYEGIPHLLSPVVTDMKRAAKILEWAVERMEERYGLLLAAGVRNIAGYNALPAEKKTTLREKTGMSEEDAPDILPHIVIVVDELADLIITSGKEVEFSITRLAQKSRAVGIHMILATQRPSTNVITGLIKANMPTRISFRVSSKIDSRVVLDANGADKLLGTGDMLYMTPRSLHLRRAQGTLVTDAEVRTVVDWVRERCPAPEMKDLLEKPREGLGDPMAEDDLYDEAVRAVLETRLGSASMLQRRLGIGYTRASRLVDMMGDRAIVGPHLGSKAREVLVTLEEWEASRAARAPAAPEPAVAAPEEDPEDRVQDESWD